MGKGKSDFENSGSPVSDVAEAGQAGGSQCGSQCSLAAANTEAQAVVGQTDAERHVVIGWGAAIAHEPVAISLVAAQ
jgi:hypothetical protein